MTEQQLIEQMATALREIGAPADARVADGEPLGWFVAASTVRKINAALDAAAAYGDGWIRCSERMPEVAIEVDMVFEDDAELVWVVARIHPNLGGGWEESCSGTGRKWSEDKALFWRPRPALPQEVQP